MKFTKVLEGVIIGTLIVGIFFGASVGFIFVMVLEKYNLLLVLDQKKIKATVYQKAHHEGIKEGHRLTVEKLNLNMKKKGLMFCEKEDLCHKKATFSK